jgi:hypothetical protein
VAENLRAAEYRFSPSAEGAWTAPNRAQGLRGVIDAGGLRVQPRRPGAGAWSVDLRLSALGRPGAMKPVDPSWPALRETRVEILRGRGLVEWFRNDERGLEQGFDLAVPPAGDRERPLVLEMTLATGLDPLTGPAGNSVLFLREGRLALLYSGLVAFDSTGAPLTARMELVPGRLRLVVDDREAVYPLTVDPLLTDPSWTGEGGQSNERFGISVASAGDVNGDGFDDIIVGAYRYDNGQADEGRALVYHGSATGPSLSPDWSAEGDQSSAYFGFSVSGAGDVNGEGTDDVVVGAYRYDNGQSDEGRAFVYLGSPGGLAATPAWTAESGQASAYFGYSVAGAGDVNDDGFDDLLVGARFFDNGNTNEGSVFLFLGSASGPEAGPAWSVEGDQDFAELGYSVDGAGNVNGDAYDDLILGSRSYDNGQTNEGRALVFHGSATGPGASPDWIGEIDQGAAEFGAAVRGAGDVNDDGFDDVIVGAHLYTDQIVKEGGAFVYLGSGAGLATQPVWSAFGGQDTAELGFSVDGAGDVNGDGFDDVIVGARGHDAADGTSNSGRVEVYLGSDTGLDGTAAWSYESNQAGAELGYAVAGAGDVDGDTAGDVLVGAQGADPHPTLPNAGQAHVFLAFAPNLTFALRSPPDGVTVHADSPPDLYSWSTGDMVDFKVIWSRSDFFGSPRKSSGKSRLTTDEFTPDASRWRSILRLARNTGTLYWKVQARDASGAKTDSEVRSFHLADARQPGITGPPLDAVYGVGDNPPTITWVPNHNESFRILLSVKPWMSTPRVTSGKGYPLTGDSWELPPEAWQKVIEKLLPRSEDGFIWYTVLAKDAAGRKTTGEIRYFRVLDAP